MTDRLLLYGATGYTGRMLAEALKAEHWDVVLGGRNEARLACVAQALGLPYRVFDLTGRESIDGALADVGTVLNAAGPFPDTAPALMAACLRSRTHYLDLAGEWSVVLAAQQLSAAAASVGIMLMPAVGFTLAASDCLLAMAAARTPDAVLLRVGLTRPLVMSRGTAAATGRLFEPWVLVRRDGELFPLPSGQLRHEFDFGFGLVETTAVSMPDVVAGEHTTGVRNIEFYCEAGWGTRLAMQSGAIILPWTDHRVWEMASDVVSFAWARDPSDEALRQAGFVMVVEAVDRWRRRVSTRMRTMDGYSVSVFTAREMVKRVMNGAVAPGFQTPAGLYGGEFILDLGCAYLEV